MSSHQVISVYTLCELDYPFLHSSAMAHSFIMGLIIHASNSHYSRYIHFQKDVYSSIWRSYLMQVRCARDTFDLCLISYIHSRSLENPRLPATNFNSRNGFCTMLFMCTSTINSHTRFRDCSRIWHDDYYMTCSAGLDLFSLMESRCPNQWWSILSLASRQITHILALVI